MSIISFRPLDKNQKFPKKVEDGKTLETDAKKSEEKKDETK